MFWGIDCCAPYSGMMREEEIRFLVLRKYKDRVSPICVLRAQKGCGVIASWSFFMEGPARPRFAHERRHPCLP